MKLVQDATRKSITLPTIQSDENCDTANVKDTGWFFKNSSTYLISAIIIYLFDIFG